MTKKQDDRVSEEAVAMLMAYNSNFHKGSKQMYQNKNFLHKNNFI